MSSLAYECKVHLSAASSKNPSKVRGAVLRIKLQRKSVRCFRSAITLEHGKTLLTLSISGDYADDRVSSCGQCIDSIREQWGHHPDIAELCDIWERWHLNDLRPGTVEQMKILDAEDRNSSETIMTADDVTPRASPETEYLQWASGVLGSAFMFVDREYKFGAEWLFEPMPRTIVRRIKRLASAISSAEELAVDGKKQHVCQNTANVQ